MEYKLWGLNGTTMTSCIKKISRTRGILVFPGHRLANAFTTTADIYYTSILEPAHLEHLQADILTMSA